MSNKKSLYKYDLIVIGSGPAGEKGAAQAAYFGKKVALVEQNSFLGGATASTTIPSKTLRETSLTLSGIRARHLHGVDLSIKRKVTVKDFLYHERNVKNAERIRVKNNMLRHNITVYNGRGTFYSEKTIRVKILNGKTIFLNGNVILIATGSSPRRPVNFPENPHIYDSDTILHIKRIPKDILIIGGGVIGCEYACIFAELGVHVTLINNKSILLPFLDHDVSLTLENSMVKMNINLIKPENVKSCKVKTNHIMIELDSGNNITTEVVMLATGRKSNTDKLNLKAAGIQTGKNGLLAVDQNYQVIHPETLIKVPGIYAAGDVIGRPALASTSMEQARYAMIKAFNLEPYKKHVAPILPLGIYTIPECSMVGKTEKECKKEKIDYVIGKSTYKQNARGMIIGEDEGFMKLIFEYNKDFNKPMKLLGVHILGEIASELIHIGVNALMTGANSDLFIESCFNYPTLSELYKYATYNAMNNRVKSLMSD